jgi:hypothetical protein
MYRALFVSPMIPSFHIEETAAFFINILGFSPVMESEGYAIYQKDNLTIHLLPAGVDIGQMEFYMEVDAIDAFWASIEDRLQGLAVRPPFNREYGMREIHIQVPQTNTLLFIGQVIP